MTKQENNEDALTRSSKPKERRIVTWTQEEDDILREQINLHGTENWTIIASKFKDKTTRQCRRRWYTYLNSDFKKGGWSPEEDMLLCEAQKIFGNRWTEIAKVVSGRTDNAVKNRFTTLCKKKAKHEALAKENSTAFNVNSKRVLIKSGFNTTHGVVDGRSPLKKLRRAHISDAIVNRDSGVVLQNECGEAKKQVRPPFAVLAQNVNNSTNKNGLIDDSGKTEGTFIRKDDPKVAALMQQAELLSSLAVKVNMRSTDQNLENAWKVLQSYISKNKGSDEADMKLNEGIQPWETPSSSEYSTGSTILSASASDYIEQSQPEICSVHDDVGSASQSAHIEDNDCANMSENAIITPDRDYSSPVQVTPIFRSMASTIPSPQFSESERHFLLRTLGIDSAGPNTINNHIEPPPCRKALLQGL